MAIGIYKNYSGLLDRHFEFYARNVFLSKNYLQLRSAVVSEITELLNFDVKSILKDAMFNGVCKLTDFLQKF